MSTPMYARACLALFGFGLASGNAAALAVSSDEPHLHSLVAASIGALIGAGTALAAVRRRIRRGRTGDDEVGAAFDDIPGLLITLRPDGRIDYLNRLAREFFGHHGDTPVAWTALIHPDDVPRFGDCWQEALRTGRAFEIEIRTGAAGTARRWMQARVNPMRDRNGSIVRWCALLTDTDTRKHAEDALRTDARDLRVLLDSIPGFIFTLTPEGEIEQVNQRIVEFFGLPIEELRNWHRLTHPDDVATITDRLSHSLRTGDPYEVESRGLGRDGSMRWFQSRGLPIRDEHGSILRWCVLLIDIDDRHRAEQSLRENERHLRLILDTIPAFIHTVSPAGEVEHVNRPILDFFGLPAEGLRDWSLVTHPDDIAPVGALLARALETGTPFECESRARRADGVYRWMQARGRPLRDAEGRIVRWYHVVTDIDDRRRAEEALRVSEHQLRLIVDSIPGLICTHAATGEVEYANKTLLDYTGLALADLRNWSVLMHPEDRVPAEHLWRHAIASGVPLRLEARLRRADGVYKWFQCAALPLRDGAGAVVRWYSLLTDIEDRKNAENVLRERERELALFIETLPTLVWSAWPDGRFKYVNSRVLSLTGATLEQLGENWRDYVHPDDIAVVSEAWTEAVRTGSPHESQHRLRLADGSYRWIHSMCQLGRDSAGRPTQWYGLFIDIDQRVNAEEALRDTRARLSRATRLATVGEVSAAIAHEINQPLFAVITNAHVCQRLLTAAPPDVQGALRSADRIVRDGRAAADVIQRIRALYRQAPLNKDELHVNEVIAEVITLIAVDARRQSVVLRTDLQSQLPTVMADRVQLQQLLANLVRNALEAMEAVVDRTKELRVVSRCEGDKVVVKVCDTGTGMDDYAAAFEPFFTTKAHGMGMGLAICRSIVEAHGGALSAERATPWGSVFSLSLPFARDVH